LCQADVDVHAPSDGGSHSDTTASSHDSDKLESWVDWIQRVTEEALAAMTRAGVPDWIEEQQRRKWRWAGHVCRRDDGRWMGDTDARVTRSPGGLMTSMASYRHFTPAQLPMKLLVPPCGMKQHSIEKFGHSWKKIM